MDAELTAALGAVAEAVAGAEDPKEVASLLYGLQSFRSALSGLIDDTHERLAGMMKRQEEDFGPGIGMVRRSRETKTRWNNDQMLKLLMDQYREVDLETGEVKINGFELAEAIKECVAFSYWRKTPLRGRKIDFSEYCTSEYGRPRVRFLSKEGS
jgi:hypothetical protein